MSIVHRQTKPISMLQRQAPSASASAANSGESSAPTNKLIVKNLPFEATKRELKDLFGTFGQVTPTGPTVLWLL